MSVTVDAGDGNDSVTNTSALATLQMIGGADDDRLSGNDAAERVDGGPGNDLIQASGEERTNWFAGQRAEALNR